MTRSEIQLEIQNDIFRFIFVIKKERLSVLFLLYQELKLS